MAQDLKNTLLNFIKTRTRESAQSDFFREPLINCVSAQDERFEQLPDIIGPHHKLPQDFLPQAGTVIVFFIPFTKKVVESNRTSALVSEEWARAYLAANSLINQIGRDFKALLPGGGVQGATVKATHTFDPKTLLAPWSHRSAAQIAGLGSFGLNRMLITPLGGAGRLGVLFVSAELEPDPPLQGLEPCLHLAKGTCGYCVKKCPGQALTLESFDRQACYAQLLNNGQSFQYLGLGLCDVCGKCVVGPCGYRS